MIPKLIPTYAAEIDVVLYTNCPLVKMKNLKNLKLRRCDHWGKLGETFRGSVCTNLNPPVTPYLFQNKRILKIKKKKNKFKSLQFICFSFPLVLWSNHFLILDFGEGPVRWWSDIHSSSYYSPLPLWGNWCEKWGRLIVSRRAGLGRHVLAFF